LVEPTAAGQPNFFTGTFPQPEVTITIFKEFVSKKFETLVVVMSAVHWWKSVETSLLIAFGGISVQWNSVRLFGKWAFSRGGRRFA
jgi:hypothetical protein